MPWKDGYTLSDEVGIADHDLRWPEGRRMAVHIVLNLSVASGPEGITRADVEDIVSFYTMFYTRPVGTYVLQVCRTLSCALNGAERVTETICGTLGIKPGETDATGTFTLIEVECLGACDRAPVIMVNDAWHECQSPEQVVRLLDDLRVRGDAALTGCHHVIEDARR